MTIVWRTRFLPSGIVSLQHELAELPNGDLLDACEICAVPSSDENCFGCKNSLPSTWVADMLSPSYQTANTITCSFDSGLGSCPDQDGEVWTVMDYECVLPDLTNFGVSNVLTARTNTDDAWSFGTCDWVYGESNVYAWTREQGLNLQISPSCECVRDETLFFWGEASETGGVTAGGEGMTDATKAPVEAAQPDCNVISIEPETAECQAAFGTDVDWSHNFCGLRYYGWHFWLTFSDPELLVTVGWGPRFKYDWKETAHSFGSPTTTIDRGYSGNISGNVANEAAWDSCVSSMFPNATWSNQPQTFSWQYRSSGFDCATMDGSPIVLTLENQAATDAAALLFGIQNIASSMTITPILT